VSVTSSAEVNNRLMPCGGRLLLLLLRVTSSVAMATADRCWRHAGSGAGGREEGSLIAQCLPDQMSSLRTKTAVNANQIDLISRLITATTPPV